MTIFPLVRTDGIFLFRAGKAVDTPVKEFSVAAISRRMLTMTIISPLYSSARYFGIVSIAVFATVWTANAQWSPQQQPTVRRNIEGTVADPIPPVVSGQVSGNPYARPVYDDQVQGGFRGNAPNFGPGANNFPAPPPSPEITIAELKNLAMQYNPSIRKSRQKIAAAQGAAYQAGLYANPVIAYEGEEIGDEHTAGKQGFALEQEIITGGKIGREVQVANQEIRAAIQEWNIVKIRVQNDVTTRAYELLAARRMVVLQRELLNVSEEGIRAAEALFNAKEVSKIDLLQARIQRNETSLALENAIQNERAAWERLCAMVGDFNIPPHRIADSLELVPVELEWDTVWDNLRSGSPEVALAQIRQNQNRANVMREIANSTPNVTVSGGVMRDNAGKQTIGSVGVSIPLQIFNRNEGNIRKAKAELAVAGGEIDRQVAVLRDKFAESFNRHQNAVKSVKYYRDTIIPDSREALEMSIAGYKQGEYNYLEQLVAQQKYLEMQSKYLESLKELAIARTLLEGMLLEGGLEE